jgi:hypothetical protein
MQGAGRRVLAVVAMLSAAAAAARGQQEPSADAREEARAYFERGTQLMVNENWEVALVELQRSFEVYPTRAALFNIAMCEKALHHYHDSLVHFRQWQERYGGQATEDERRSVETAVSEMSQYLGMLVVTSTPPGATIRVDGEDAGITPMGGPLTLDATRHRVEVSLEGYLAATREIVVAPTQVVRLDVTLEPEPEVPVVVLPGGAGGAREDAGIHQAWFWTTASTAVLMGIGGAIAGGITMSTEDELNDLAARCRSGAYDACDDGRARLSDYDNAQMATNVLLFGAGAVAAAAVVLAVFTDFGGAEEPPPVQVTAGPAGAEASATPSGLSVGITVPF